MIEKGDFWKGEHLIRAPKRPTGEAVEAMPVPNMRRNPKTRTFSTGTGRTTCSVDGCDTAIMASNSAQVCRKHKHRVGYCKCRTCRARDRLRSEV